MSWSDQFSQSPIDPPWLHSSYSTFFPYSPPVTPVLLPWFPPSGAASIPTYVLYSPILFLYSIITWEYQLLLQDLQGWERPFLYWIKQDSPLNQCVWGPGIQRGTLRGFLRSLKLTATIVISLCNNLDNRSESEASWSCMKWLWLKSLNPSLHVCYNWSNSIAKCSGWIWCTAHDTQLLV